MKYDLIVIGGGPGGYVAAIKAAQLGQKVALVEKDALGGTCLNRGCIPTKALIHHGHIAKTLRCAKDFGFNVHGFDIDYASMVERKDGIVAELCSGVSQLLKLNGVDVFTGNASFVSENEIKVQGEANTLLEGAKICIATGSSSANLPNIHIDGKHVHDSTTILEITKLPKHLVILGAGYIGCEFASLFSDLGVKISMIEFLPGILWLQGKTVSQMVTKPFLEKGIELHTGVKMEGYEIGEKGVNISLSDGSTLLGDQLLVCVGRAPYTKGLKLENVAIEQDKRGFIKVDDHLRTSNKNIYAIGDVTGKSMLAHVASYQGIIMAKHISNYEVSANYDAVPAVIFTDPEVATTGISKEIAIERGFEADSATFPFAALGKAKSSGDEGGMAEIIFEKRTHRILGAVMVGHEAGNMIAEITMAIQNELVLESIAETIHPHPTLSEAWMEAADLSLGHPIHLPPMARK